MKSRYVVLILACLVVLSCLASADDWSKSYALTGRPTVKVESSDASVRVTAGDINAVHAHVSTRGYKIDPDNVRIIEHQVGNIVEIEVRLPRDKFIHFDFGNHRVDIDIQMPREGTLGIRTGDGHISVTGIKGDIDTWSGDGSEEISGVDGTLRARTGDGRITATGRFDVLELNTGDGRIDATALPDSTLGKEWSLHTGDGSVTLRLPPTLAADVDLHTSDGHITLDLPLEVNGRFGGNTLRGKMNGGGKLLSVHTGDGSITIGRS